MNRRRILLINLLNRHQRFDSDACRLTLKDTDHWVDSSKRRNNAENLTFLNKNVLTLLSNLRFLTLFRCLKESTHCAEIQLA